MSHDLYIYQRGSQVWFKRKPNHLNGLPDACFMRDMGEVNGERVCEIEWRSKMWIVRYSEICGSTKEFAERLKQKIDDQTLLKQTKKDLAAALGIFTGKLLRWRKFIALHLEEDKQEKPPAEDVPLLTGQAGS